MKLLQPHGSIVTRSHTSHKSLAAPKILFLSHGHIPVTNTKKVYSIQMVLFVLWAVHNILSYVVSMSYTVTLSTEGEHICARNKN
jgi:hypothetical protein